MGWRVLLIEESEYLSVMLDNLKVKTITEQEIVVPLTDIHTLILDNYKLVLSVQLINKCAQFNVNIVICGIDHNPNALIIPHSGHHLMALNIHHQMAWSETNKSLAHKIIVEQKIRNQLSALVMCDVKSEKIHLMENYLYHVEPSDCTNREGLAAKVYFHLMFGEDFQRFDEGVINAGLNYGYAILRSQINKVVVAKGLNSAIGIIHKGPGNMFNLSDDLIEIFRPIVDMWVKNNLMLALEFTREHRMALVRLTTTNIRMGNQRQTLFNAIVEYVESVIDFMENDGCIRFPVIEKIDEL